MLPSKGHLELLGNTGRGEARLCVETAWRELPTNKCELLWLGTMKETQRQKMRKSHGRTRQQKKKKKKKEKQILAGEGFCVF